MCPIKLPSKLTIHKETWKFQYIVWPWASSLTTLLNRLVLNSCLRVLFLNHFHLFARIYEVLFLHYVELILSELIRYYWKVMSVHILHRIFINCERVFRSLRLGGVLTLRTLHTTNWIIVSTLWTPHNLTEAVGSTT